MPNYTALVAAALLAIVVADAANDSSDSADAMAGLRGAMPVVYPAAALGSGHPPPPPPCPPLVPLPKTLQVLGPMAVPRSVAIKPQSATAELSPRIRTRSRLTWQP